MGRSKSDSSLTFAERASTGSLTSHKKVTLPRVKDFAISVVTSLWRPTSRICEASTCAASSSLMPSRPSQFASTKRVFCLPDRLRLVHLQSHPVRPCLQSLVVVASFSSSLTSGSANVPAGGARIPWVSQGPPLRRRVLSVMLLLLWAVMGANVSWRKGKCGQCTCWTSTTITVRNHLGFSAVWKEIHQEKAAELLALTERLSLRKWLVDVKEVVHVAGVLGWSRCSHGSRL